MQYANSVLPVMRGSREMLLSNWGKAPAVNQKTDSAWSVVTQLDLDVERRTREALTKQFPDIEFVGEEDGGDRKAEKFWLMDPIDGTAHYMRGLPFCTSMLALIDKGQVVFGAIYDFIHDEMYFAEKGAGAFKNDEPIRVSERPLKSAFISLETRIEKPENDALRARLGGKANIVKSYSAGWEFAMVASGRFEARICFDPYGNDYDFAPGTLLVAEAGGVVANIGKSDFDYRNLDFIAGNPAVYRELAEGAGAFFPIAEVGITKRAEPSVVVQ